MRPVSRLDVEQARRPERLQRLVVRHARPAAGDHRELPVVGGVPVDRRVHGAAARVGVPLHQRRVPLVHRPVAEGVLEHGVGPLALRQHHQAGGADVEPVHDALPLGRTAGGHAVPHRGDGLHHGRDRPSRDWGGRRPRPACPPPRCRRRRRPPVRPGTGWGGADGGAGGAGMATSSQAPAATRSARSRATPSTVTSPASTSAAAVVREKPKRRASATSRRRPSRPSGTGRVRRPVTVPRPGRPGRAAVRTTARSRRGAPCPGGAGPGRVPAGTARRGPGGPCRPGPGWGPPGRRSAGPFRATGPAPGPGAGSGGAGRGPGSGGAGSGSPRRCRVPSIS